MRFIHFLHIGKNAGTQIKLFAHKVNNSNEDFKIKTYSHGVTLRNLPIGSEYFFSIRSPLTRFKSGFYSRKRKGRPRHNREWSIHEFEAFSAFEHANDLAEALFDESDRGFLAFSAMKSIMHCASGQADWFVEQGFFLKTRMPIAILRQEHLNVDLINLSLKLNLKAKIEPDPDPVLSHQNSYEGAPSLSEKANANLRRWYAQDCEFYRQCCQWIERQGMGS